MTNHCAVAGHGQNGERGRSPPADGRRDRSLRLNGRTTSVRSVSVVFKN
jgi:hypothetical protein